MVCVVPSYSIVPKEPVIFALRAGVVVDIFKVDPVPKVTQLALAPSNSPLASKVPLSDIDNQPSFTLVEPVTVVV